jgi:hypothetical protein
MAAKSTGLNFEAAHVRRRICILNGAYESPKYTRVVISTSTGARQIKPASGAGTFTIRRKCDRTILRFTAVGFGRRKSIPKSG